MTTGFAKIIPIGSRRAGAPLKLVATIWVATGRGLEGVVAKQERLKVSGWRFSFDEGLGRVRLFSWGKP